MEMSEKFWYHSHTTTAHIPTLAKYCTKVYEGKSTLQSDTIKVSISMIEYEHGCCCNVYNCRLDKLFIFILGLWTLKTHCVQLYSMPHSSQLCLQVQTCLRLHARGAECKGQSLHWSSSALSGEWQYDSMLNIHTVNTTSEVDSFM